MFSTIAWMIFLAAVTYFLAAAYMKKVDGITRIFCAISIDLLLYVSVAEGLLCVGAYSVNRSFMAASFVCFLFGVVTVIKGNMPQTGQISKKAVIGAIVSIAVFFVSFACMNHEVSDIHTFLGKRQLQGIWLTQSCTDISVYQEWFVNEEDKTDAAAVVSEVLSQGYFQQHRPVSPIALLYAMAAEIVTYQYMFVLLPFLFAVMIYWAFIGLGEKGKYGSVAIVFLILAGMATVTMASHTTYGAAKDLEAAGQLLTNHDTVILSDSVSDVGVPLRAVTKAKVLFSRKEQRTYENQYYISYEQTRQAYEKTLQIPSEYPEYEENGCLYLVLPKETALQELPDESVYAPVFTGDIICIYRHQALLPQKEQSDMSAFHIRLFYVFMCLMGVSFFLCVAILFGQIHSAAKGRLYKILPNILFGGIALVVTALYFWQALRGDMLLAVMFLAAVLCASIVASYLRPFGDGLMHVVLGIAGVVLCYLPIAAVLILLNRFSIGAAMTGTFLLVGTAALLFAVKKGTWPRVIFQWKENRVPVAICLLTAVMLGGTFGLYPMGQDEGVYQTRALSYIHGNEDTYLSFPEYEKLTDAEQKGQYYNDVAAIAGYDMIKAEDVYAQYQKLFGVYAEKMLGGYAQDALLGNFHGIHTYSALLALWGKIVGELHMLQMGMILFVLSLYLLWLVFQNLHAGNTIAGCGMALYALSPQLIWQSKSSLVESLLSFVILVYLYVITDKKHESQRWLSAIAVVVFSVLHITIYVFMPVFVCIYYYLYATKKDKKYLISVLVSVGGYLAGFWFMCATSYIYVLGNYDRWYHFGINQKNLPIVVTVVCVLLLIITAAIFLLPVDILSKRIDNKKKKAPQTSWLGNILVYVIGIGSVGMILWTMKSSAYPFSFLTMGDYMACSGFVLIPLIYLLAFVKPKLCWRDENGVVLSMLFVYCILIYATVFKREVHYYYYYGRYIVPYVAIIYVYASYLLSGIKCYHEERNKLFLQKMVSYLCVCVTMFISVMLLPYTEVVTTQQDLTELQWYIYEEIANQVEPGSAVVICRPLIRHFLFQLKFTRNVDVYIANDANDSFMDTLAEEYGNVYYITDNELDSTQNVIRIGNYENKGQVEVYEPKGVSGVHMFIPFPEESSIYYKNIAFYKIDR